MWNGVVTNVGTTLLERWSVGGKTLNIERASVGSGTVAADAMRAQTTITDEVGDAAIISKTTVSDGTAFRIQVQPADETAYTCKQIGIWGKLSTDNESILIALFQNDNGVSIPTAATEPEFVFTLYAIVAMSNQGQITVNVDGSAYVSQETLDLALASYVKTVNGIVPGTDGNVQLPIDAAPTAGSSNPVSSGGAYTALAGKVSKSGDTMTGDLILTSSGNYPTLRFLRYADEANGPQQMIQTSEGGTSSRLGFYQRINGSSAWEGYRLPATTTNLSSGVGYDILTSKPGTGSLYYAPGETYSTSVEMMMCGHITNGVKNIHLGLWLPKSLERINGISVTTLVGSIRGINGYIGWTSTTNFLTQSGLTITANRTSPNGVRINIANSSDFTNATANTPVSLSARFTLSFS